MLSRKLQIVLSIAIIIIISFGVMFLMMKMKKEPPQKEKEAAKIYVKTKKIEYKQITPLIIEGGRLGSQNKVDIISEVQGKIMKGDIALKKGQCFKKGDLLAKIYNGEAKNNLIASKSRFLNTLANALPDINIDYPESYDKWLNFFESIDIKKQMPEMPEIKSAKEKIFLASRNILNEYYSIESTQIRLAKYMLYAPFSGSFTIVNHEVGSTVNPGSKLGTIIQTDRMELEVPVKIEDVKWLKIGDKVSVSTGNAPISGIIARISNFVKPETQAAMVFINLKSQPDIKLFEGMYLTATFEGKKITNAMEMPRNSVFDENKVFVVENGKLKKASINIHKINEKTLVFSGLTEGVELVVEPLINIDEGISVEILK